MLKVQITLLLASHFLLKMNEYTVEWLIYQQYIVICTRIHVFFSIFSWMLRHFRHLETCLKTNYLTSSKTTALFCLKYIDLAFMRAAVQPLTHSGGPKISNAASINPEINFPCITVRLPHNKDRRPQQRSCRWNGFGVHWSMSLLWKKKKKKISYCLVKLAIIVC